jgi:protein SCO1/2
MAALNGGERRGFRATLLACTITLATFVSAAGSLTRGFQAWTHEELRVLRTDEGRLLAPPVTMRGADGALLQPWPATEGARPPVYIVDFIFTRCETVCLALGTGYQQMQRALQSAGGAPGVQLLSVSFDIERDQSADLAAHARRHAADPAWWRVAAPVDATQNQALLRALGVVAIPDGGGGFVHNAALHVIDAQGRVRGLHALDAWQQALEQARLVAVAQAAAPAGAP